MARPIRIEFPGALYHITSRGNARQSIFEHFNDKKQFLSVLDQVVVRYHWLCHAYCLMDNHYHLLIETSEPTLSVGMRQLNGVYTQAYNRKYQKVGHLFQGRFKSILVEKETYLLELCRYIVLNPVRAKMVTHPRYYTWSSFKATSGIINPPSFLSTNWILEQFHKRTPQKAQEKYRLFVSEGINQSSPWEKLKSQCLLGSDRFIAKVKSQMQGKEKAVEIPKQQRIFGRPSLGELFKEKELSKSKRNEKIKTAIITHGYSQAELSDYLGLHYSTISRLLKMEMSK
jgi:putative transposase